MWYLSFRSRNLRVMPFCLQFIVLVQIVFSVIEYLVNWTLNLAETQSVFPPRVNKDSSPIGIIEKHSYQILCRRGDAWSDASLKASG